MTSTSRCQSREPAPAGDPTDLPPLLLAWYDRHRRILPWRAPPGRRPDPYHVWLSEIMLQQTTVIAVAPYFEAFLRRWPDLAALAEAELDEVLHAWQGLGYYARARNLHRCAGEVLRRHGGRFPEEEAALLDLPGIGSYTAAAVAAIAFDQPASAVDGNVERVMARLYAIETPMPEAKAELRRRAAALVPAVRPGDYAQALMDLGATICTPRKPNCILCPWREACLARRNGIAESLPARKAKAAKPMRRGVAFWVTRRDGAVLLRRRPREGLLGGMIEIPSTEWRSQPWTSEEAMRAGGFDLPARQVPGLVRHSFTHFDLELTILWLEAGDDGRGEAIWATLDRLGDYALPNLMKKIIAHVIRSAGS